MISIEKLKFQYPKSSFKLGIEELKVDRGSKVAIVGPSGSGKTTLLRLISGIYIPDEGQIKIDGLNISGIKDAERRNFRIANIGFVFQDFELVEYLNVHDNILLPFLINRSLRLNRSTRKLVEQLAYSLDLGKKLKQPVGKLSQGEKQRVAICRALLTNPQIILADEPTGNLDLKNKHRIVQILFERSSQANATLLMVTHEQSLLEGFERVIDFQNFEVEN